MEYLCQFLFHMFFCTQEHVFHIGSMGITTLHPSVRQLVEVALLGSLLRVAFKHLDFAQEMPGLPAMRPAKYGWFIDGLWIVYGIAFPT